MRAVLIFKDQHKILGDVVITKINDMLRQWAVASRNLIDDLSFCLCRGG